MIVAATSRPSSSMAATRSEPASSMKIWMGPAHVNRPASPMLADGIIMPLTMVNRTYLLSFNTWNNWQSSVFTLCAISSFEGWSRSKTE